MENYLGKWSNLTTIICFFQMGCNHQLDSHLEPQSHGGLVQMIFHDFPFQLGDFWGSMFSFRGVIDLEGLYHTPKRTMKMGIQHFCSFERWFLLICSYYLCFRGMSIGKIEVFFFGSCGHVVFACCCFLWWCFRFEVGLGGEQCFRLVTRW